MVKEKIAVRWSKCIMYDFGRLNEEYAKGELDVDRDFWKKYCDLRFGFEKMHHELILKIRENKRVELNIILNPIQDMIDRIKYIKNKGWIKNAAKAMSCR